jgi:hypothetical protein
MAMAVPWRATSSPSEMTMDDDAEAPLKRGSSIRSMITPMAGATPTMATTAANQVGRPTSTRSV